MGVRGLVMIFSLLIFHGIFTGITFKCCAPQTNWIRILKPWMSVVQKLQSSFAHV